MRKTLTTFTLILILLFTFCFPSMVLANTTPTITRLAGNTRYDTSAQIAIQGWSQSDYAILAYGENYPDALTSAPLAKKYNAPILLTTQYSLPDATKQALTTLQVKNVIIVGGTGVISSSIDSQLQSMGISVSRVFGNDKYETAIKIDQQISTTPSSIFVCTGDDYADALSIAPIAAIKQLPIVLVPNDIMPNSVRNYISTLNINETIIMGNTDVISDNVANQFPHPHRFVGADKYERNVIANRYFNDIFNTSGGAGIATGENYPDALSATAYCAKVSEPLILVNFNSPSFTRQYYQERIANASGVTVFGGIAVIPDGLVQDLGNINSSSNTGSTIPSTGDNSTTPSVPSTNPNTQYDPSSPSSFTNPYPLNSPQTIQVKNLLDNSSYSAEITAEQIIRGQQAWSMIKNANMFNQAPKNGYEYLLAKINFKLLDITDNKALNLFGIVDFKLVSQNGREYDDFYSLVEPSPDLSAKLYKGASSEGWVAFLVRTDDLKPIITYKVNYDGSGGVWIKAYGDGSSSSLNNTINTGSNFAQNSPSTISETQQAILGTWQAVSGVHSYTLEFYNDGSFKETSYTNTSKVHASIIFEGYYSFSSSTRIRMVTTKSWVSITNNWDAFSWDETDNIALNGNQLTFDNLGGDGKLVFTKAN